MLTATVASVPAVAAGSPSPPGLPDPVPCDGCWAPALETSWQWQLQGPIDTSFDVDMYDVDGAGAAILSPPEDNIDVGQRQYRVEDPEGHRWMFAQP